MNCAWNELLAILPPWIRAEVDRQNRYTVQEIRLRINSPPEIVTDKGYSNPKRNVVMADIRFCINAATQFSPWAAATAEHGYITAQGGHRIGLCGQTVITPEGKMRIQEISSLCIRVAKDYPGIADAVVGLPGSILILGAPGWGKSTLLRDLTRQISKTKTLCVADERCELFPAGIPRGERMDVMLGCPKSIAIETLLRTMTPEYIAADEITAMEDSQAMIRAVNCGVHLIATAHGTSVNDFLERSVYKPLVEQRVFDTFLVLRKDKTYTVERMTQCR